MTLTSPLETAPGARGRGQSGATTARGVGNEHWVVAHASQKSTTSDDEAYQGQHLES